MNAVASEARIESWNPALTLRLTPLVTLDDDQLFAFCQLNRDLGIDRDAERVLDLMAPAGGLSSAAGPGALPQLANWAQRDGRGLAIDSSAGFILANGAMRSPDASGYTAGALECAPSAPNTRILQRCTASVRSASACRAT